MPMPCLIRTCSVTETCNAEYLPFLALFLLCWRAFAVSLPLPSLLLLPTQPCPTTHATHFTHLHYTLFFYGVFSSPFGFCRDSGQLGFCLALPTSAHGCGRRRSSAVSLKWRRRKDLPLLCVLLLAPSASLFYARKRGRRSAFSTQTCSSRQTSCAHRSAVCIV